MVGVMRYAAFIAKVPKQIIIQMSEPKNSSASIVRIAPVAGCAEFPIAWRQIHLAPQRDFAAIGEGVSDMSNYSSARDCQSTLDCLEALGVKVRREPELIVIEGKGLDGLREATRPLDVGNSGSTIRMLSGILAGQISRPRLRATKIFVAAR